jgi:hypothetical protein
LEIKYRKNNVVNEFHLGYDLYLISFFFFYNLYHPTDLKLKIDNSFWGYVILNSFSNGVEEWWNSLLLLKVYFENKIHNKQLRRWEMITKSSFEMFTLLLFIDMAAKYDHFAFSHYNILYFQNVKAKPWKRECENTK